VQFFCVDFDVLDVCLPVCVSMCECTLVCVCRSDCKPVFVFVIL